MISSLIAFIVIGLIAGFVARAVVPGPDPMGVIGTIVLGMVGSLIAGFIVRALTNNTGVGVIGSIIGAIAVLLVYRAATRGRTAA